MLRNCTMTGFAVSILSLACIATAGADTVFVRADASAGGDGQSWATAFDRLQDALSVALADDEIWIAQGTYHPAEPNGDRTATFQLVNGVRTYGGFNGTEACLSRRDPRVNVTILSGDLNDDDEASGNAENSYNVVTASGMGDTTLLEGVHVVGGNANGSAPDHDRGAAIYNDGGVLTFRDCVIRENTAAGVGAGLHAFNGADCSVLNCMFSLNESQFGGAGMYIQDSDPFVVNSAFDRNSLVGGGGESGGVYVAPVSQPAFINCTFSLNTSAEVNGGAIFIHPFNSPDMPTILINCVLWGNTSASGPSQIGCDPNFPCEPLLVVTYSCIEGGWVGESNIASDPLFVDAPAGDLHLQAGSPCIDAGITAALPCDVTDDLDGGTRLLDDPGTPDTGDSSGGSAVIDMGALEFKGKITQGCLSDLNADGVVDPTDLAILLGDWGPCP